LVQSFGDISLVTEMVSEPITHFGRTPAADVYKFIISELEQALNEVPDVQSDHGRVTKQAVRHMLAKVYLTRGYEDYAEASDFANAASYADAAIGGQPLSVPYDRIFAHDNEVNNDVVFAVQYDQSSLLNGG